MYLFGQTQRLPEKYQWEGALRFETDLPLIFAWERSAEQSGAVGFGTALRCEALRAEDVPQVLSRASGPFEIEWGGSVPCPYGPWFGGLAFDTRQTSVDWKGFSKTAWNIPELLFWRGPTGCFVSQLGVRRPSALRIPPQPASVTAGQREAKAHLELVEDHNDWTRRVKIATQSIAREDLIKVVVARAIDVAQDVEFDPLRLFEALRSEAPTSTLFLIRSAEGDCFLGASPETLLRVRGRTLETEAIAATATSREAAVSLYRDKERREQEWVSVGIREALEKFTDGLEIDSNPSLLELKGMSHLKSKVRAMIRSDANLSDILLRLHPTPAVGGLPKEAALDFIAHHEGFDRGWYAGAVGWLGPGSADLSVAIRSALVRGRQARLFVGAGIVSGSLPEDEWAETRVKSEVMLRAFRGAQQSRRPRAGADAA